MVDGLALISLHSCPAARPGRRDTGGMNVYLLQVARQLGRAGVRVDVFTRHHDPADPQVIDIGENARVVHIRAGSTGERKENLHEAVPEFVANLEDYARLSGLRYDLLHSHYWLSGLAGMKLSRALGVPHVATFHTLGKLKLRARPGESESAVRISAETTLLRSVDGVVVSTRAEAEEMTRLYGVGPGRVAVIAPGVDLDVFRPRERSAARERLGVTEPSMVLYVGRLEPLKGLDILVRAVGDLAMADTTRLVVVGGDSDSDQLVGELGALARSVGVAERVTFAGAVPQRDLPWYYSAADVLVLPSHYESFGMVALEAMACGTPVVVSRVGGLKTFVRNGESGYLVPWRCSDPFSQQIEMILANPSLRRAMGDAALIAARGMGWTGVSSRLMDFYNSLMERPAALVGAGGA